MKKTLLISLVLSLSAPFFANASELDVDSKVPLVMHCELYLMKLNTHDGNDVTSKVSLIEGDIKRNSSEVRRSIGFSQVEAGQYSVSMNMSESVSNGSQLTNVAIEDLVTGLSTSFTTNAIQTSGELRATLHSTQKLKIFGDRSNVQLTLSCQ